MWYGSSCRMREPIVAVGHFATGNHMLGKLVGKMRACLTWVVFSSS